MAAELLEAKIERLEGGRRLAVGVARNAGSVDSGSGHPLGWLGPEVEQTS